MYLHLVDVINVKNLVKNYKYKQKYKVQVFCLSIAKLQVIKKFHFIYMHFKYPISKFHNFISILKYFY